MTHPTRRFDAKPSNGNLELLTSCIQTCFDCHTTCLTTLAHCLQQGGAHQDSQHLTLMLDCAEICQTSANFMLRNSALYLRTCGVCAEICDTCAMNCQRFTNDQQMQTCTEICRRCAELCRQLVMQLAKG